MPGLVPGIHGSLGEASEWDKDVDGRDKPGQAIKDRLVARV